MNIVNTKKSLAYEPLKRKDVQNLLLRSSTLRMGGFFSSQFQDPEMLKLATQYKVRKVNNVTIDSISQTTTIIMNMIFALFRCPCRTPNS